MKERFKNNIKSIDWVFFGVLLFLSLSPLIIKIIRTFFINDLSGNNEYSLAVSWGYLYLIYETISVFVIAPIYSFIKKNTKNSLEVKEKSLIAYLFALISTIITIIFISLLSIWISQRFSSDNNVSRTYVYLYLIIFGLGISIHLLINAVLSYVILTKRNSYSFLIITFNVFVTILIDFLFLSRVTNPDANLTQVGISNLVSSVVLLLMILAFTYFPERKEWNNSLKTVSFLKWKKDYSLYLGSSLWLGLEALTWNIFYILGVTIWLTQGFDSTTNTNDWENAFWTMDGLFWGGLLVPTVAINIFVAEGISQKETTKEKREIIKIAMLLNLFVLAVWVVIVPIIIFILFPVVLENTGLDSNGNLINLNENVTVMSQKMSLIILVFFVFQLPSRTFYTYFATTGQGFKAFFGTLIGGSIVWITSMIIYFSGVQLNSYYWISIIYGLGLLSIFILYYVLWVIETKKWYKPKTNGVWAKLTNYQYNIFIPE